MGKLKTRQAVSKRVRVTKNKKVLTKKAGQDHYNARESGKTTRLKRRTNSLDNKKNIRNVLRFLAIK